MNRNRYRKVLSNSVLCGLALAGVALAADRVTIVSEGVSASVWRPDPAVPPMTAAYPSKIVDKTEDVCIGIGYLLKEDGSTSDYSLLTSWGSKDEAGAQPGGRLDPFAQNAVAVVSRWRFVPLDGGKRSALKPLYTAATFAFSSNPAADLEALRGHCTIADLPAFVAKAQAAAYKKGDLNKGQMERNRAQNPPAIPLKN
jgi:hypothetical protein